MPNLNRRRGFAHERDLLLKLWRRGFAVIRAPASGAKARRFAVPDIVAIKNNRVLAFEVKTAEKKKTIYIPKHQVEKLLVFIRRAGGYGFIAVKIVGESGWRFIEVDKLEKTASGNYKVSPDMLVKSFKLGDLVSFVQGNKRIDEYI
ncbi:Holliday junction resolvase Hjc [Staphylothermus hellenicus]|uniref:Crossover junction endodeoxyribonuclease Hjc n=1 Tax=Staphylothermus hellenicus (strain DSM 12710 / JCM 10830 / BK20S6-10-b1 / P8) TaxID=591019 RepID=D7DC96_STAHD|nr:Holliday junction resolvase Hjc [Staphylothermus hellenicus]ADI31793.1 Resolvase, Holliday junction-type [Staphylothermus hellenicus DSM 12710]